MKIINEDKHLAYDLEPDTVLDMERTNPFFNEQGEQSLPVDIPASEKNRNILGFADQIGSNQRGATRFNATIIDGSFVATGRQAILSAQRKGKISTSFYLNEGAMYSKIEEITLQQMFGDELIPGLSTVYDCMTWCRLLFDGSNPNYCIFPALINAGKEADVQLFKWVNRYGYDSSPSGEGEAWIDAIPESGSGYSADFYNASVRSEMNGDAVISVPIGYYITPFIRGNYLLSRIFSFLGYSLNPNFFSQTAPFTEMVFCNSCIDTLANGVIRVSDLVPECTISVILDIYRKKFNCEFIPNEINKSIDIVLLRDEFNAAPVHDLTPYVVSQPEISFPEYKQIKLSSDDSVSTSQDIEEPESFPDMITKYPLASYDLFGGYFIRIGYKGTWNITQRIAPTCMKYYAGSDSEIEDIVVPDCVADMYPSIYSYWPLICIGNPIERNSSIVLSDGSVTESNSNEKQPAILAFWYTNSYGIPTGTITNYRYVDNGIESESVLTKIWDYTLVYNGPDGIFEKFYRPMDSILRSSKHTVIAKLNIPEVILRSIPSHKLISMYGQSLFINNLRYKIGNKKEPMDSEFFTTKIHTPADLAPYFEDYFPQLPSLMWVGHSSFIAQTEDQYNASEFKDRIIKVIYPPIPDPLIHNIGTHYFEQKSCIHLSSNAIESWKLVTYWLEVTVP